MADVYAVEIHRKLFKPSAPGFMELYHYNELVEKWPVLTGPNLKKGNTTQYDADGPLPAIPYEMVAPIQRRVYKDSDISTHVAFLRPRNEYDREEFSSRSFHEHKFPAMMSRRYHEEAPGIVVKASLWRRCREHLNEAFRKNGGRLTLWIYEWESKKATTTSADRILEDLSGLRT